MTVEDAVDDEEETGTDEGLSPPYIEQSDNGISLKIAAFESINMFVSPAGIFVSSILKQCGTSQRNGTGQSYEPTNIGLDIIYLLDIS